MTHRLLDHVGEVELELGAQTEEGLFEEATAAFRELVDGPRRRGGELRREVALPAEADELLLVDWLNELVFLAEVEAFVPDRIEALDLRNGLRSTVVGTRGYPRPFVKAATLNGLELSRTDRGWHAHVTLDV
jgi:SHS2 domain-containing protein